MFVKPSTLYCPGCGQEVRDLKESPRYCNNSVILTDPHTGHVISRSRCGEYIWPQVKGRLQGAKWKNRGIGCSLLPIAVVTVMIVAIYLCWAAVTGFTGSQGAQNFGGAGLVLWVGAGILLAFFGGAILTAKKAGGGVIGLIKNLLK